MHIQHLATNNYFIQLLANVIIILEKPWKHEDLRDKSSGWELVKEDALVREGNRRQKETGTDSWGGVWCVISLISLPTAEGLCKKAVGEKVWKMVWLHFM